MSVRMLWIAVFLGLPGVVPAQPDASYREDLRFAEALRARGDNDLAMELLRKLSVNASPELTRELPLEFARTRLRLAGEDPDSNRRLNLYREARDDFRKFIESNAGHPRLAEARLDMARVLNLMGKTELQRSNLAADARTRADQAKTARTTLEEAARQLDAAAKALQAQLPGLPDPAKIEDPAQKKQAQADRTRLENEIKQTEFDQALNLYDQAATYATGTGDEAASNLLIEAKKRLDALAGGPANQPITWKARAWQGRILFETETAEKARAAFQSVLESGDSAAAEGIRLARYFRLLVLRDKPTEADRKAGVNNLVLEAANRWRNDYRRFHKTPEGMGLTFLLAETLLREADTNKKLGSQQVDRYRTDARNLLREVENRENEFTERARRLKIEAMVKQGLLKIDIAALKTFEECYVRAQFEQMQMNQEANEAKDPKQAESKKKQRVDAILNALGRGLALPETAKMKGNSDLDNARALYTFWALQSGRNAEAIKVGEAFARDDPRSRQAEMAAVYALQAYGKILEKQPAKTEEPTGEREQMLSLAQYMEERWPDSLAGDVARHAVGLEKLREENFAEAIRKLARIGPGYENFPLVCYQLADACLKAEKAGIEPLAGDKAGDYRVRALAALERMPETSLGADPFTNQIVLAGKAMLGREWFRGKRFQQMDELAGRLLNQVAKLRFNDDEAKDRAIRNQLRYELTDVRLYARYGLAEAAYQAGQFPRVAELLDPLVDAASRGDDSPEKTNLQKNQQLGSTLLILALRASIQSGKIDRTEKVLEVLDRVGGEENNNTNLLRLLAFLIRGQIDEVRKKGNKDSLDKAIESYRAILDKRVASKKDTSPDFLRVLADCYSSMGDHARAAEELAKIEAPREARPGSPEEQLFRRVQVERVRELRRSGTTEHLQQAREMIDRILGPVAKPNWGRRDLLALKESALLLEAEERLSEAFAVWSDLTRRLAREASKGGAPKENYLECYYHMIDCYTRMGMAKNKPAEREKYLKTAALQMAQLEKGWPDFGSEPSKKRFLELLEREPLLREQYELVKKK